MNSGNNMDDYSSFINNYPGMEYNNQPVDVEATLNSLLDSSSPAESYDFSASLLSTSLHSSSPATLRTSSSSSNVNIINTLPLRPYPPSIANNNNNNNVMNINPGTITNTSVNNINSNINNVNINPSGIPLLPPPPPPPPLQHSFSALEPLNPAQTAAQLEAKRKRRRKDDILPDEVCKGFDWNIYQPPQLNYLVYDGTTMQLIGDNLDLAIYKSSSNTHFSTTEKAWISYRQNQFKIFCLLKLPQISGPMVLRDGAMNVEIKQFYVKLYAIKGTAMGVSEEVQVGIYHAGKSRVKKEKTEITAIPFIDGKAEFTNLQFERSNAAKGQQEYFHLVVTLYAKTPTAYYPLLSRISPRIIVRSQHPGFYGPPSPEQSQQDLLQGSSTSNSNYTSSEDSTSPKMFENDPAWQQTGEAVYRMGKVGINTSDPTEALTVHGNALVTGNLYKPSDRRIKSDFVPVDSHEQLDHIRNLKIYDYKIKDREERGVIAQELQQVMPPAVHEAGDVHINGETIPNLLVVNERSLLYENIGATQQLDRHLEREKSNIVQIDMRVEDIKQQSERDRAEMQDQIRGLTDMFLGEEVPKDAMGSAWKEEQVVFGVNLFRMGPARSFMVLGYFVPYLWLFGALFIFSSIRSRKILGRACIFKFVVWSILHKFVFIYHDGVYGQYVYWAVGMTLLLGNWRRNKRRMEARRLGLPLNEPRWGCCERMFLRRGVVDEEDERERFLGKARQV